MFRIIYSILLKHYVMAVLRKFYLSNLSYRVKIYKKNTKKSSWGSSIIFYGLGTDICYVGFSLYERQKTFSKKCRISFTRVKVLHGWQVSKDSILCFDTFIPFRIKVSLSGFLFIWSSSFTTFAFILVTISTLY